MSETPKDPLAFDFGVNFESVAERVKGERDERSALVKRELSFHHAFLDDILRSILPYDLMLIGAESGLGKTELARIISSSNAAAGKNVFYFALEAEPKEIERRTKFSVLCEVLQEHGRSTVDMNYPDWYRGRCDHITSGFNSNADQIMADRYSTLHTYYRGSKFDHHDIKRLFLAIQSRADLIVLDHLHYVDIDDDNENRGFKTTMKMIRDIALGIGRPVIMIAHLRKRDMKTRGLVPILEDFHGSSDIIKIITSAIMLAPARCVPVARKGIANTFVYVPKDRMGGQTGLVAMCEFDMRFKNYAPSYTLGRIEGDKFSQLAPHEVPRWAKRHQPLAGSEGVPVDNSPAAAAKSAPVQNGKSNGRPQTSIAGTDRRFNDAPGWEGGHK